MNELGEMLGGAVEGGLVARAVEPAAGSPARAAADGHTHEGACLNCGTALVGPHCHACGQRAHVHRTIGAFFHDLLHGVLHFEGKTWRTLPMLAWKPGKLTREYIEGKRAKYISPIALFLFVVFVSFALWSALGGIGDVDGSVDPASAEQMQASLDDMDKEIATLEKGIQRLEAAGDATNEIARLESELESKRKARRLTADLVGTISGTRSAPASGAPSEVGEVADIVGNEGTEAEKSVAAWIGEAWKHAKANPSLLAYKLQSNAYKLSWLLIPLSLPFMWLLFPFSRKFRMYDHTVFVTYSIAFMTILVLLSSIGAMANIKPLVILPMLYAPYHLYRQLRDAYALSRGGAIWRLFVLSAFIWLVLGLFALVMMGLVL
ncbi:DUF3667 domain-containing protein [Tsuneonella sp. HG222]